MRSVFRCLADPYVHVLVGGLVLFRLASGNRPVDPAEPTYTRPIVCKSCHVPHDPDVEFCPHLETRSRVVVGGSWRDLSRRVSQVWPSRRAGDPVKGGVRRSGSRGRA